MGISVSASMEPQEKNLGVHLVLIGFLSVIELYILRLVHPLYGSINHLLTPLHSCKVVAKLFSVASCESL
jgi:hypothetical protein